MGIQLEKPKLFPERKTFIWFVVISFFLLLIRLFFLYSDYNEFVGKPFYYTEVTVLNAYKKSKNTKTYTVLKLKSKEGLTFYTTTHRKENFNDKYLRLQIFPDKHISFRDYLGTFYVKSKIKYQEKIPKTDKNSLRNKVALQHSNKQMVSFYNAIFFATPLDKILREKIALLGVSHLVALSGFHLGILWALVYGLLLLLYRPLQQKFFPYRHALFDVGIVAMILLGLYVWFVDYPPSLIRSYAMVFIGWVVLILGMELLSFTFLVMVLLLLCVVFPSLLVSLAFWLSLIGVFYIFLLLQYTKEWNKWMITLWVIPIGIFVLMLPVVHTVFGMTSSYQMLSPLLSILFIPFYPLAILLHLLGLGGFFDTYLMKLFTLPTQSVESLLPLWSVLIYGGLSITAIWYRKVFYVVCGLATGYGIYLFMLT
jgi:competence protein ComEC